MVELRSIVGFISFLVEVMGVMVLIFGLAVALVKYFSRIRYSSGIAYEGLRQNFGRAIIIGLEFLIAGDIIRTVALPHDVTNLMMLAGVILIRTFLSFTLHLELEGRWPWQDFKRPLMPDRRRSQRTPVVQESDLP
jgi:uncharacterized membrane protein